MLVYVADQYSDFIKSICPLGNGHINDTYFVETDTTPFVLQKINTAVFPNPEQIMANLMVLNQHMSETLPIQNPLKVPELLVTKYGKDCVIDKNGDYWRALSYIENTESLETISNLAEAEQVGIALGKFHRLTYTINVEKLHDTLLGFHICPDYMNHYEQVRHISHAVADSFCSDFIQQHQQMAGDLETAKEKGWLAMNVIHGDPKLNNFLFDKDTRQIVSLIDLDTVKPGLVHYDIADCLRSCCHESASDTFNLELGEIILTGYLNEVREQFTSYDYQYLYPAIRLFPFELGLRFYTDYLEGNRYFKVTEPEENLRRAISQFRLCKDVLVKETEIKQLIDKMGSKFQLRRPSL